tara:strand:+ start:500 stop:862 length:363 start_codon:yes stop_codon:yes gene_type:complete
MHAFIAAWLSGEYSCCGGALLSAPGAAFEGAAPMEHEDTETQVPLLPGEGVPGGGADQGASAGGEGERDEAPGSAAHGWRTAPSCKLGGRSAAAGALASVPAAAPASTFCSRPSSGTLDR